MNLNDDIYAKDCKPLKLGFLVITLLVLALATMLVIQKRSHRILEKTDVELVKALEGLTRVKEAIVQRKQALATFKTQQSMNIETASPERLIYGKVDEIMAQLKPNDMTITTLERKGGDVSLQYTLKFISPKYSDLLNALTRLQQSVFPFTPVNTIAISQSDQSGKGAVEFTINGSILIPERIKQ